MFSLPQAMQAASATGLNNTLLLFSSIFSLLLEYLK